ncbi:putative ribonuclease H-like domain-containing protein [Tanacetum coccineum]
MTGNKAYLAEYQDFNGGPVAFGGSKGYITGKGKIKTGKLDFEDVCFVKELQHFNLFSVSQMCDKKNKVLFTDSECLVLSPEFKLPDENQVLLRIPRQNNMYSFNLENIVPSGGLACLISKPQLMNLTNGIGGKQHKASCKAKSVSSISQPLQLLHMDLFGPTSVRSLNHKTYCLVITDDFSRFSWVFFLRTKDETSGILKDFIRQIENQLNQKVKTIRCDNGTEFKNRDFIEFCGSKGIKREYSNARTPQQNGVAERKNRTLIEAARTMLADSFLPNTFWAEAVSTACYVLNRVLVTKPQNKTPYELITGKIPIISYIRPFGCHVTILNTIDHLGKFDGKSDEGFLVGYSLQSKAFRVYNLETKRVEENLHITFLENKPNVAGKGPTWLFDLDYLTDSMNYQPVRSENQANKHAGPQEANQGSVKSSEAKNEGEKPNKNNDLKINEKPVDQEDQAFLDELERLKRQEKEANDATEALRKEFAQDTKDLLLQAGAARASITNTVNTTSTPVSTASPSGGLSYTDLTNTDQDDSQIPVVEDIYDNPNDGIFTNASYDDEGAVADFTNLETIVNVSSLFPHQGFFIHPSTQISRRSKISSSTGAKFSVSTPKTSTIQFVKENLSGTKSQGQTLTWTYGISTTGEFDQQNQLNPMLALDFYLKAQHGCLQWKRMMERTTEFLPPDYWDTLSSHTVSISRLKTSARQRTSPIKSSTNRFNQRDEEGPEPISQHLHVLTLYPGPVAYTLELPRELQGIHNTFHVSNLKKCLSDEDLIIPLDEVRFDKKLHFIEEPIEIIDREVRQLKQSRIPIVKVRWNSSRGQ